MALLNLPIELLCTIVTFLDPITLISLSQTSRSLRAVINPSKSHLIQRLLSLELQPDHGGGSPTYHLPISRHNRDAPAYMDPVAWRGARYACAGCLKLRHHLHFDSHSLLGLGFRKPMPGWREAERRTDWEPLQVPDPQAVWKRKKARQEREEKEVEDAVMQYRMAAMGHLPWDPLGPPVGPIVREEEEKRSEKIVTGRTRHLRLCLDCRWERGDWSDKTPIVKSRRMRAYAGFLDRFFPGLFTPPALDEEIPNNMPWSYSLYMVRCHFCGNWREFAAFREFLWFAERARKLKPLDVVDGVAAAMAAPRCNRCREKEVGSERFREEIVGLVLGKLEHGMQAASWETDAYEQSAAYETIVGEAVERIREKPEIIVDYVLGHELGIDLKFM